MTPAQVARVIQNKREALQREVVKAESASIADAKQVALKLSSGSLTPEVLRRLGHPYSRRRPRAQRPEKINVGAGVFRSLWVTIGPDVFPGKVVSRLRNLDRKARWLFGGTPLMISRPTLAAIRRSVGPRRIKRLWAAVGRAMKG